MKIKHIYFLSKYVKLVQMTPLNLMLNSDLVIIGNEVVKNRYGNINFLLDQTMIENYITRSNGKIIIL